MNSPTLGLHIEPMVWAVQYNYTPDAVLMVLASDVYDPHDYIRDYDEFRRLRPLHQQEQSQTLGLQAAKPVDRP
jgi:hypothetical protein